MFRLIRWTALGLVGFLGLAWGMLELAGTVPAGSVSASAGRST
jgi:hypothetical protein